MHDSQGLGMNIIELDTSLIIYKNSGVKMTCAFVIVYF